MMNETFLRGAWRSVAVLFGSLIALVSLYLLLHAVGVAPPVRLTMPAGSARLEETSFAFWLNLREEALPVGLLWMLGSAVGVVFGAVLVALGLARAEGMGRNVVLKGRDGVPIYGGGQVTVSMRSLHALVASVAERVQGVREARPVLRLKRSGWYVDCTVALSPEVALPEVAGQLKPMVQEALEHHTGLPVARVNITGRLDLIAAQRRVR